MSARIAAGFVAAAICSAAAFPSSWAASPEEEMFLRQILEASMDTQPANARGAYATCRKLESELKGKTGFEPLQRLYMEAELQSCFFGAKLNGGFTDETGDACGHHYAYATKLAQVITEGKARLMVAPEVMDALWRNLERATEIGPQAGCTGDYAAFAPAIAIGKEEAAKPPPALDDSLFASVGSIMDGITKENAAAKLEQCKAFAAEVGAKPDLEKAERAYFEGWAFNCEANVIELGQLPDPDNRKCAAHFAYASKLADAIAAGKEQPVFGAMFSPMFQAELTSAKESAPTMGCTQDYGALKGE